LRATGSEKKKTKDKGRNAKGTEQVKKQYTQYKSSKLSAREKDIERTPWYKIFPPTVPPPTDPSIPPKKYQRMNPSPKPESHHHSLVLYPKAEGDGSKEETKIKMVKNN